LTGKECTCPFADCLVHDEWYWRERRIADTPDECDTTRLSDEERLRVRLIQATHALCLRAAPPPAPNVEWSCDRHGCGTVYRTVMDDRGDWHWFIHAETGGCLHDAEWVVIWRYPEGTIDCATCGDRLALRGEWDATPEIRTIIRLI
jgi:hypothetical protein